MEDKKDYIDLIEENIADGVMAFMFLLVFILAGFIASYFMEVQYIKDITIGVSTILGILTLILKIKGGNN